MPSLLEDIENINGAFVKVEQDGILVAFCCYTWVRTLYDVWLVDQGAEVNRGDVLYLFNLRIAPGHPTAIWRLRAQLPMARWIIGLDAAYRLHAPKGVPEGFDAALVP